MSNTPTQSYHATTNVTCEEENHLQEFSDLMTARMADGKVKGYCEWQDPCKLTNQKLLALLFNAIKDSDWGSVGAYAMMAHQRGLKYSFNECFGGVIDTETVNKFLKEGTDAAKHH